VKRHPSLQKLSDDHHRALVLARRLRRLAAGTETVDLTVLSREVQQEFDTDLEPHFRIEERCLLPALRAKGADELARRTTSDHTRLRELVRSPWTGDTVANLGAFLETHVRFEERTLFPKAEALLSDAELASLREASENRRRPGA